MPAERNFIMFRGPGGLRCRPHINSELEIIVVTKGKIDVTVGDTEINAEVGDAVLILPYDMHAFSPHNDSEGRVYMFSFGLAEEFYNSRGADSLSSGSFPVPEEMRQFIAYATETAEKSPDEISAKALFFPLISEYLRSSSSKPAHNHSHSLSVRKIVDYIQSNLTEKITLRSAAAALGINPASLSAQLREYTGIPFTDFVNNLRLEKAVHLLYDCDISVTEAAYLSGFGSIRNFNRIFFDTLGITPTEYKKTKI